MNRVLIIGRLTIKPTLAYTNTNLPFTRFSVAVNRQYTTNGDRKADFIPIQVWRKQAENVCQYLDKGALVSIEGRLQTDSYTDKQGNKRNITQVIADNIQFLEKKVENKPEHKEEDIYTEFGENIEVDDNFLD